MPDHDESKGYDPLAEALIAVDGLRFKHDPERPMATTAKAIRLALDAAGYRIVVKSEVEELHQQASHWFAENTKLRLTLQDLIKALDGYAWNEHDIPLLQAIQNAEEALK